MKRIIPFPHEYQLGDVFSFPEKELCHCGDGTAHYHAYEAMWDGSAWARFGTPAWDKAVSDFARAVEQTGILKDK